jgi:hypothetical protein
MLDRTGDTGFRIRQRRVEVEIDRVHRRRVPVALLARRIDIDAVMTNVARWAINTVGRISESVIHRCLSQRRIRRR